MTTVRTPDPITVTVTAENRVVVVTAGVPVATGGETVHNNLSNRDATDAHPIAAVTGLQTALDAKATTSALTGHTSNTSNPHSVTAAQAGADPAGTGAAAGAAATATAAAALTAHVALTEVHGISAFGASLAAAANAAAARGTLGLVIGTNVQAYDAALTAWALKAIPAGVVVGTSDTQTLTGKTLSTGTVISLATMTLGSDGTGDIYYRAAGGALTRLPIGTSGYVLTVSGGLPAWVAASGGGLSEPLTVPRFTAQSSAPSAASAGEGKIHLRALANRLVLAVRGEFGSYLEMPSSLSPFVRAIWAVIGGTIYAAKGHTAGSSEYGTDSQSTLFSRIVARNKATAASANAYAGTLAGGAALKPGSGLGEGFFTYGLIGCPDSSYGSGSSGCVINCGVNDNGGYWPGSSSRPAAAQKCAMFEYNTNQGDTAWQFIVNDGSAHNIASTGLAFVATHTYLYAVHCPRGGSSSYATIIDLDTGDIGSATIAALPGSTATVNEMAFMQTFGAVARNIRTALFVTEIGGAL